MGRFTFKLDDAFRAAATQGDPKLQRGRRTEGRSGRTLILIAAIAIALGIAVRSFSLETLAAGLRYIQLQLKAYGLG